MVFGTKMATSARGCAPIKAGELRGCAWRVVTWTLLGMCAVAASARPSSSLGSPQCFDHQTLTYNASLLPVTASTASRVIPYFSPGQTQRVLTEHVLSANKSIDIYVASWSPYLACGTWKGDGCSPDQVRNNASDSVFVALVNQIHRGVKVRMLVGHCSGDVDAPGTVSIFPFLSLTGADVRMYATTSFVHAKMFLVDGVNTLIMSANFDGSGFNFNREAGAILQNADAAAFAERVFDADWSRSLPFPSITHLSASQLALIKDTAPIPLPPYPYLESSCAYNVPDPVPVFDVAAGAVDALTFPDVGYDYVKAQVEAATQSVDLYIYVVDSFPMSNILIGLHQKGIAVRVLVSSYVVPGPFPNHPAIYRNLTNAGVPLLMTGPCLQTHHQKFWVVDGETVIVSTNNWAQSEMPETTVFPPGAGADRGLAFTIRDPKVTAWFQNVMDADWQHALSFHTFPPPPPASPPPPPPSHAH